MATLASLRTALTARLGLATLTTAESARLDEALNGAVARTFGDGLPGLVESYVGTPQGSLATTISSHSGGSADITLASVAGVFPRDIFTDATGTQYIVRAVTGSVINVGVPVASTLSGSVTVTRRALELPHAGQVLAAEVVVGATLLPFPQADIKAQFETSGEPSHYSQHWSAGQDKSYVALYPAPTNTTVQIAISQVRANAEDADIDAPYPALEPILAHAHQLYLTWTGALDGPGPSLALRDRAETADLRRTSHDDGPRSR